MDTLSLTTEKGRRLNSGGMLICSSALELNFSAWLCTIQCWKGNDVVKMIIVGRWGLFMALLFLLLACGNSKPAALKGEGPGSEAGTSAAVAGNAVVGKAIFNGELKIARYLPCTTCHYVEPGYGVLVGPNMNGVAKRAGQRVAGKPATQYLRESILKPEAYTVPEFPPGTMNQSYEGIFTEEQINDVIAYLMTLK